MCIRDLDAENCAEVEAFHLDHLCVHRVALAHGGGGGHVAARTRPCTVRSGMLAIPLTASEEHILKVL